MYIIILGSHQSRCRSFVVAVDRLGHSIAGWEFAEHHGRSHRRWLDLRNPSAGLGIGLVTEQVEHHSRLADQGIADLETVDLTWVRRTVVLAAGAFHHIEGNRQMEFRDILRE